jgi:thioesterase domain-containing protein/aryl carrier-like protein
LPRLPSGKVDRTALNEMISDTEDRREGVLPPRDVIELQLVQLWAEFFDVRPISVTDNFFELGGHSLMAMRIMTRIRGAFGQDLPLASLVEHGTIDHLAMLLRQSRSESPSSLVPIQPRGDGHPFFCVHPSTGGVLCYMNLARALGDDRPFFALQSLALERNEELSAGIEEMASAYLQSLRDVQPAGPYLLSGWSTGAVVAYEMASQLVSNGERISHLFMLDPPSLSMRNDGRNDHVVQGLNDVAESLGLTPESIVRDLNNSAQFDADDQLAHLLEVARRNQMIPEDMDVDRLRRHLDVHAATISALGAYQPQPHPGPVTIIGTDSSVHSIEEWKQLAGENVSLATIPGDHFSMLREPVVHLLARNIRSVMNDVADSAIV